MLKKSLYLFSISLFLSSSLQAGKHFDSYTDDKGSPAIFFKKSGRGFKSALSEVLNYGMSHDIRQVHFHESVSEQQKQEVIETLSKRLNLIEIEDGLLEDSTIYKNMASCLNASKREGFIVKGQTSLDLRFMDSKVLNKALPAAKKMVEEWDKVEALHFSLGSFSDLEMFDVLKLALLPHPSINVIYFHSIGLDENSEASNTQSLICDLIYNPRKINFIFNISALSAFSTDLLDKSFGSTFEILPKLVGQKTVMPFANEYIGSKYSSESLENYKNVCIKYSSIFKASYVDMANEKEQESLLREMLVTNLLKKQLEKINEVIRKESFKHLAIYSFEKIKDTIQKQNTFEPTSTQYLALEQEKQLLINSSLRRMNYWQ